MPWHHLLVPEEVLWNTIEAHEGPINAEEVDFGFADFGVEGYKRFVFKEYQQLNRLTAVELVELVQHVGFVVERKELRSVDAVPPPELLDRYSDEVLRNNEIFLLLRKGVEQAQK